MPPLTPDQIEAFITTGCVRLDDAFPRADADAARDRLWRDTGCDPDDPTTWTRPVIRLGLYPDPPFAAAANTERLHAALDALIGPDRWLPCRAVGTFPVRFPSAEDPGDAGWHLDVSYGYEHPDFMQWRANITSKGRALLMLMLFSDVGPDDAPTRIRLGSHHHIARRLAPAGDAGLTLGELVQRGIPETAACQETLATGPAGTVWLCHPFLVHSAQPHRGARPRFMAQPPILPKTPLDPFRPGPLAPVEEAIRRALA